MSGELLKRAVINIINQLCIMWIDFGDRTLNLTVCAAMIILVEMAVGHIAYIISMWYDYRLRQYIKTLPTGFLTHDQINAMMALGMNDFATYQIDCDAARSKIFYTKIDPFLRAATIFQSQSYINLSESVCKKYSRSITLRPVSGQPNILVVPIYNLDGVIISTKVSHGSGFTEQHCQYLYTSEPIPEKVLLTVIKPHNGSSLEAMEAQPAVASGATQMTISKHIVHPMPQLSRGAFIHSRADEIYNRLVAFRDGLSSRVADGGFVNLGITLHGPPGCGKTTMITWICNILKRNCVSINLATPGWTANGFKYLLTSPKPWLQRDIQDIVYYFDEFDMAPDHIITRTKQTNTIFDTAIQSAVGQTSSALIGRTNDQTNLSLALDISNKITLETLLTTFDGIIRVNRRVIIASTNRLDRIDSALLRPGRLGDIVLELTQFTRREVLLAMAQLKEPPPPELFEKVPEGTWSPADVMQKLRSLPPEQVVAQLGEAAVSTLNNSLGFSLRSNPSFVAPTPLI